MTQTLSQRSWAWIKTQKKFGSKDLASEMDVTLNQAQMVIDHLKNLGAIESSHRGFKGAVYLCIDNAEPHLPGKNSTSPRPTSVRQRMWQAIRYLNKFTVEDVISTAECSRSSAEKFISDLRKYQYIAVVRKINVRAPMSKRTGQLNQYLLVNNTGHKYPVLGPKGMRDQNKDKLVPLILSKTTEKQE